MSFILWWGAFLILSILFLLLANKGISLSCLLIFFVVQEVRGLLFLLTTGMGAQVLFLFLKGGVAPAYF